MNYDNYDSKPQRKPLGKILVLGIVILITALCLIFSILFRSNPISPAGPTPTSQPPTNTSVPPTVIITPTFESPPTSPAASETPIPAILPSFPWPVPKPSAFEVLTLGSLGELAGAGITLRDVDERITNALDAAGYDDRSYYAVPGGFAIVTRLEKMDASYGYPDYPNRWTSSLKPISFTEFSVTRYLEALFGAPKGHYRVFVFVVSSEPVIQSGTPIAQEEAQTWIVEGANRLPNQMKDLPYTREHTTTVYVYEFIQSGIGAKATYNIPSDFTGRTHLKRAGLWEYLTLSCLPDEHGPEISYGDFVQALFCPSNDQWDVFQFSGTRGDRVRISARFIDSRPVLCIELYDQINHNYFGFECGSELEKTYTLDQTGDYLIYTSFWPRDDWTGNPLLYTLELERLP